MTKYLKYTSTALLMVPLALGILAGGAWMWLGLATISIVMIVGDSVLGEDLSQYDYSNKHILNFLLYFTLPMLLLVIFNLAWMTGSGDTDLFGFGAFMQNYLGLDLFTGREATETYHFIGAVLGTGLAVMGFGGTVAHELFHRIDSAFDVVYGRWIMAIAWNADFSIEHVYGHHENVATECDPATAKRGENVYGFIVKSTIGSHKSAWELESKRLKARGLSIFSYKNQMLSGYLMSLALMIPFWISGGSFGLFIFLSQALVAKIVLEAINFVEHYGLIRVPGQEVKPRHSWNTNKTMSSAVLFSLTRHSAHHENGALPFWDLEPYPDAPEMPYGYLTCLLLSFFPNTWRKTMAPKLQHWDAHYATKEELAILHRIELERRKEVVSA